MLKKRWLFVLAGIVVIVGSLTFTVFAAPPEQEGTEDGEIGAAGGQDASASAIGDDPDEVGYAGDVLLSGEGSPLSEAGSPDGAPHWSVDDVIGDDPDEDGYTGEVFISDEEILPSEPGSLGESMTDWGLDSMDPQPDEIDSEHQGVTDSGLDATWYYHFTAGSTMHARDSDTSWAYGGVGCVYAPEGTEWLILDLQLPNGAVIEYLRIYFYDGNATYDGTAWISRYNGAGDWDDIISAKTTGNSGYGSVVSAYSGETIDTYHNSYALLYRSSVHDTSLQLCGLRIFYNVP